MTTAHELLPCPFCGGANVKASGSMSWTYVWCADCKAQGPTVWHGGPTADKDTLNRCQSEAIAAWNRREAATALSEAKAENERLRSELGECACPYPSKGRPRDETVKTCMAAHECGCSHGVALGYVAPTAAQPQGRR